MKFKKIIASVVTAVMLTSITINLPINTIKASAGAANYSSLDAQAYSGKDLGAIYTKSKTTFKVWAPTASSVKLKRYTKGSDTEQGASVIATDSMAKGNNGIWSIEVSGDIKNQYYTYLINNNGTEKETVDVYAKAVGVNGDRGMVVDLDSTDPEGWENDEHVLLEDPTDAIVWEVHVKDFSIDSSSGVSSKNRGKYLAFTEKDTTLNNNGKNPTCLSYLKELGVTHVQLLPIYDYGSVNETNSTDVFNWGYDPKNYNAPEGSYSTDPYNGEVRINELKQAVQSIHEEGIGVVMDVVYNHTYSKDSWLERTVPGYYYRYTSTGAWSDGSGCGNETRSESAMYRKYMIDSVLYWAEEYHIDAFRFDLMGVHDVTTMNMIKEAVNKINPDIMIYGEPWSGGALSSSQTTAMQSNMSSVSNEVAAFNDKIRDSIKGSTYGGAGRGFVQGATGKEEALKAAIQANSTSMAGTNKWAKQPSQVISYISAHDNLALYDHLVYTTKGGGYNNRYDDVVQMNKLAAGIYLTSQGMSFMQAGEEFARTKQGDENSYKSSVSVNKIDWNRTTSYSDLVDWYKGLMEIRKAYKPFRDPTNTSNETIYFSWGANCPANVIAYTMNNKLTADSEWNYMAVIHNANDSQKTVNIQGYSTLPTQWVVIANGSEAGVTSLGTINGTSVTVPARSTMILVDKTSFDSTVIGKTGNVSVKYVDQATGKEISISTTKEGKVGTSYTTSPKEVDGYELVATPSNAKGSFIEGTVTVIYEYVKDNTPRGTVTVKYVNNATGDEIQSSTVTTGKEGSSYSTEAAVIKGYELDSSKLPSNASGKYTDGNINVTYYYNEKEVKDLTVHYYNANSWNSLYLYAYGKSGTATVNYTGKWPGTKMTNDGDGWWSYEVTDVTEGLVIFNNGGSSQEPAAQKDGYAVEGEVWIKDGIVYTEDPDVQYGKVITKYLNEESGEELATSTTQKGVVGKTYTTTALDINGYELVSTPSNAKGTYTKSDITVTYYYKEVINVDDLVITSYSMDKEGPVLVDTDINLSMETTGGEGTIKYKFVVEKDGEKNTIKSYSTRNYVSWTAEEVGTYKIHFYAKDENGQEVFETKELVVKDNNNDDTVNIISFKTNLASSQKVGTKIKLGVTATGEGTVKYSFEILKDGKVIKTKAFSSTNYYYWTPEEEGKYVLRCIVKDDNGSKSKEIDYTVIDENSDELKILSFKTNLESPQEAGISIKLGASAQGKGTLKYRFVVLRNGINVWTRAYSSSNTAQWTPQSAGDYVVYCKVKDSTGEEVVKTINYVVTGEMSIKIDSLTSNLVSPQLVGAAIKFTAKASSQKGTVKYKYVIVKDAVNVYSRGYTTSNSITWKPTKAGTYTVVCKATDSSGKEVSKSISFLIK